jgi:uncharacterized protein
MHRLAPALVAALILGAGCGYGDDQASTAFAKATVLIETDDGSKLLTVEVAENSEQRAQGLMHRKSLGADSGMVFVFFEPTSGGFWMKNTLIPLSIAYFDVDGEILRIMDMKPCTQDPCETYNPGVDYMGALEVNQGAFEKWGVEEGDVIHLTR